MHIQDCLSPKRIFNKYTQSWQYVSCGKCEACRKRRTSRWVARLKYERKCWKYCAFVTLTHSDENVPRLTKLGNFLVDLTHVHQAKGVQSPVIDLEALQRKYTKEEFHSSLEYIRKVDSIPYLSVYDYQCFFKRLRKNLKNEIKSRYKDFTSSDYTVRYYLGAEYGSTTFRPHCHILFFFSSEKEASCIEQVIRQSWKLGLIDFSFVSDDASSYVASYVNSISLLPKIYEDKAIRPFALFSKLPAIGTLFFKSEEIKEIFDKCSPTVVQPTFDGKAFGDFRVWPCIQSRLFPRLSYFDSFSHHDRVGLYRAAEFYNQIYPEHQSSADFASLMLVRHNTQHYGIDYLHLFDSYISHAKSFNPKDLKMFLRRWYYVSSRVCYQAACWNMSVDDYVIKIETYYNNCAMLNYSLQVQNYNDLLENDLIIPENGIMFDQLFFESIRDVPLELMSAAEIETIQSFGIDIQKFTSDDLSVRLPYQESLLSVNSLDFVYHVIDSHSWLRKATKSKKKNDYLEAHPELKNIYGNL